jgi:hypothetical protein
MCGGNNMTELELLYHQELDELIKHGVYSEARKKKLESWVEKAEIARNSGSLDKRKNQYDKAEELLTWYTFAPLFRMSEELRILTINEFLEPLIGSNAITSAPELYVEKMLPSSTSYLDSITSEHPVKYIREKMEQHRKKGSRLEGFTHIDFLIESDELIIPIEAKFTSDIDVQREYNSVRNQIARTIDVTVERAKKTMVKKVIFLLCVPEQLYNCGRLYYYKMKDYESLEKIKHDIPHQATSIDTYFSSAHVVYWKDVASVIISNTIKWNLLTKDEINMLEKFYKERLIELSINL